MVRRQALAALARRYPEDYKKIYASIKAGTPLDEVTVKEWAEQWLAMRQQAVRPGTWVADRSAITRWILPILGDKPLAGLQPSDLRAVQFAELEKGHAVTSVDRTFKTLKIMLRDASEEGHDVPERTIRTRKIGPPSQVTRKALTVEQAKKILAVAMKRADASRWVAALLQGVRPAEALGLRWSDLDLDKGVMRIRWQLKNLPYNEPRNRASGFRTPHGFESIQLEGSYHLVRPKTASGLRTVPLVPWLRTELITWAAIAPKSEFDLVWPRGRNPNMPASKVDPQEGYPKLHQWDRDQWYEICEEADVWLATKTGKKRRPLLYEARHTAATLLMASGVDETTLISIVGHSKITSTHAYLHTDETRKLAALETVGAQLGLER